MTFQKTIYALTLCSSFLNISEAIDYPPQFIKRSEVMKLREKPEGMIEVNCKKFCLASKDDVMNLPTYAPYTTWNDSVILDEEKSDFSKGLYRYKYSDFLGGWTSGQSEFSFTLQQCKTPSDFISSKKEESFSMFNLISDYSQQNNNDFIEQKDLSFEEHEELNSNEFTNNTNLNTINADVNDNSDIFENKESIASKCDVKEYGLYSIRLEKNDSFKKDVHTGNLFVKPIQVPASSASKKIQIQGGVFKGKSKITQDDAGTHLNLYLIKGKDGMDYALRPISNKSSGFRGQLLSLLKYFEVDFSQDLNGKSCCFNETGYNLTLVDLTEGVVKTLPIVDIFKNA